MRLAFGVSLRVIAILLVGLSQGCGATPSPPNPILDAVRVFHLSNLQGISRAYTVETDERDLGSVLGPCDGTWDNCISSIRVPEGWEVVLYELPDFGGRSLTLTSHVMDLSGETVDGWSGCDGNWDNCASSIRLTWL